MRKWKGADSSDWRACAGSAALLIVLLAGSAGAQEGEPPAQEPAQDEDVLDWLGGSAEPAAPTPAEPLPPVPQEEPENTLDWLSGGSETAEAAPESAGAEAPLYQPVFPEATPAARASADKLREAMTLELQVQEYEDTSIGAEVAAGELKGNRKQLWDRVQKDKEGFRQLAGQMSLQALEFPRPAPGATLSRDAVALLAALERGYEESRNPRAIEQYIELNQTFLKTADGTQRSRAVVQRDELVSQEIAWASLAQQAVTLASGGGDDDLVARMRETLAEVSPEAQSTGDDLAVLVLNDPELRQQVMSEVTAMLTTTQAAPPPPRADAVLRPRVTELQVQLAEKAGLPPLVEEHGTLTTELEGIDKELERLDLSLDKRKELVGRRTELLTRRNQVEMQWYGSKPDQETFDELVAGTDELISRRMLDLGASGALYGVRVDDLREVEADGFDDTRSQWEFVEEQQALLSLLDGVQPQSNPLRSVTLPDLWGMALLKDAQARAQQEKQLLAKSAPKPSAMKKGGGGGKSAGKQSAQSKPKMKPKPKPKPQPKKKGKGKGKKPY